MRSHLVVTLLRRLLLCLLLTTVARAAPALPTPFEVTGRFTSLEDAEGFLKRLAASATWKTTLSEAGRSSVRRLPIYQVQLTPPSGPAPLRVMVLARTHGNEPASTESALALIRDVAFSQGDEQKFYRTFEFLVLPVINPDGAARALFISQESDGWWGRDGRENGADIDINRDYLGLRTAEARAVVGAYNKFRPHLILDLHEYPSLPLVTSGLGWWRAEYWDFQIGAGRAPWAAPSMQKYCRQVAQTVLFPALEKRGYRTEFYMQTSGSFASVAHYACNAADYFLVRGTPTFLLETAGADLGEKTGGRRVGGHLTAIEALLKHVSGTPDALLQLIAQSASEQSSMRQVVLDVTEQPRSVLLRGTKGESFGFETTIEVGKRTYHTHSTAAFGGLDYTVKTALPLPGAFIVRATDATAVDALQLHGLALELAPAPFTVGKTAWPAGTYIVRNPSQLAGLLFLPAVRDRTTWPLLVEAHEAPAGFK